MSKPDTAEYWDDVKSYFASRKDIENEYFELAYDLIEKIRTGAKPKTLAKCAWEFAERIRARQQGYVERLKKRLTNAEKERDEWMRKAEEWKSWEPER
jgi:hypothetical protein